MVFRKLMERVTGAPEEAERAPVGAAPGGARLEEISARAEALEAAAAEVATEPAEAAETAAAPQAEAAVAEAPAAQDPAAQEPAAQDPAAQDPAAEDPWPEDPVWMKSPGIVSIAPEPGPRITAVTPMRNEGPFILEWVAYHRLIGINDLLIFTNDCTDGSDLLLERLDEMGLVRHYTNPSFMVGTERHHWGVLNYSNNLMRLKRSDWVMNLDADEFVCVHAGNGRLEDLFEAAGDPQVVTMNQRTFGSAGVAGFEDAMVLRQFPMAEPKQATKVRRGVKSLTARDAPIDQWGNHSPMLTPGAEESVRWVDGSGRPMPRDLMTVERPQGYKQIKSLPPEQVGYELAQINHYAVRSMDSFMAQIGRGNANHPDTPADLKYWRLHNLNAEEDRGIQRWLGAVEEEVARLKDDAEIAEHHAACVAAHRAEIAEILERPPMAKLRERIERQHHRQWPAALAS